MATASPSAPAKLPIKLPSSFANSVRTPLKIALRVETDGKWSVLDVGLPRGLVDHPEQARERRARIRASARLSRHSREIRAKYRPSARTAAALRWIRSGCVFEGSELEIALILGNIVQMKARILVSNEDSKRCSTNLTPNLKLDSSSLRRSRTPASRRSSAGTADTRIESSTRRTSSGSCCISTRLSWVVYKDSRVSRIFTVT